MKLNDEKNNKPKKEKAPRKQKSPKPEKKSGKGKICLS